MVCRFFLLHFSSSNWNAANELANKSANKKNLCAKRMMRF